MRSAHIAVLLALLGLPALAADTAPRPDAVIGYRQAVFKIILWNYQPLAEMVRGRRPFDGAEFRKRSTRLAFLAQQLRDGFTPGSDAGAMTDARPEIWTQRADFDAKLEDLVRETKALRETAKSGDEARIKEQFSRTSNACKSCHDKYRSE
jgi:cytochrome c556